MFAFVGLTVFLAFSPSSNSSSPWVTNIFSSTSSPGTSSAGSYRSQSFSLFDYFFPNTSSSRTLNITSSSPSASSSNSNTRSNNTATQVANNPSEDLLSAKNTNKTQSFNINKQRPSSENATFRSPYSGLNNTKSSVLHANLTTVSPPPNLNQNPPSTNNQTGKEENSDKAQVLKSNTATVTEKTLEAANRSTNSPAKSESSNKLSSGKGEKIVGQKGVVSNYSASLTNKQSNGSDSGLTAKQGIDNLINSLMNCDLFDGKWVKDDSYPLYKPGSCSFIDEQFSCVANGRPDRDYQKLKWKPKGCTLPRYLILLMLFLVSCLIFELVL